MTRLAYLIAAREGFFRPGAQPARKNNPGDLRHAPHGSHAGEGANDIAVEGSVADGWADEELQLRRYAVRGLTLGEAIYEWAPPGDGNDSAGYLAFVIAGLNEPPYRFFYGDALVTAETPLGEVLTEQETT